MPDQTLYYVADPMCSWCYGFAPVLERVRAQLAPDTRLVHVMGGLAPDSNEPMPADVQDYVRAAWDAVEAATGASFNRDFWSQAQPRRSTYPACRAVLAARAQRDDAAGAMFAAIQRAYYREARNPSDVATLIELAGELEPPLDVERFAGDVESCAIQVALEDDLRLRQQLRADSFPSLVARAHVNSGSGSDTLLLRGYEHAETLLPRLQSAGLIV